MVIKFATGQDGTVYAVDPDVETTVVIEKSGGDEIPVVSSSHGPETTTGGGGDFGGKGGGHGKRRGGGSGDDDPPPKIFDVVIYNVVRTERHPRGVRWWLGVSRNGEPGFFNMVFPAGWPESKIRELAKYTLERYPEVFDPAVA